MNNRLRLSNWGWGLVGLVALSAMNQAASASDCMASAITQQAMNACAETHYKQADKQLNTRYGALMRALSERPARQAALRKAERSWMTYRDADCAFAAGAYEGGSMAPMVKLQCLTNRTVERSRVLASEMPQH